MHLRNVVSVALLFLFSISATANTGNLSSIKQSLEMGTPLLLLHGGIDPAVSNGLVTAQTQLVEYETDSEFSYTMFGNFAAQDGKSNSELVLDMIGTAQDQSEGDSYDFDYQSGGIEFNFNRAVNEKIHAGINLGFNKSIYDANDEPVSDLQQTYISPYIRFTLTENLSISLVVNTAYQRYNLAQSLSSLAPSLQDDASFFLSINEMIQDALCGPPNDRRGFALAFLYNPCGGNINAEESIVEFEFEFDTTSSTTGQLTVEWIKPNSYSLFATYQPESSTHYKGSFKSIMDSDLIEYYTAFRQSIYGALNANITAFPNSEIQKGHYKLDYKTPQQLIFGGSYLYNDLTFSSYAQWIDYEAQSNTNIELDQPIDILITYALINGLSSSQGTLIPLTPEYRSSWAYGFSVNKSFNEHFSLLASFDRTESPLTDNSLFHKGPIGDSDLFSLGGIYQINPKNRFAASISHLRSSTDIYTANLVYNLSF